jgi:hypothetical protein
MKSEPPKPARAAHFHARAAGVGGMETMRAVAVPGSKAFRLSFRSPPASLPQSLCSLCPLRRPENFFQSLENGRKIFPIIGKSGLFFQPLENYFPIVGKIARGRAARV